MTVIICRPANPKELFNLRHSQCRNVIERIFGVTKKRFKMFREANEFPIDIQGQIASAICVVHNFIRIHDPKDLEDEERFLQNNEPESTPDIIQASGNGGISTQEAKAAATRRDKIAEEMWGQYQGYLNSRSVQ